MELLGGLAILLIIWLLSKAMDSKLEDNNQKQYSLQVNRDPATIVAHMKQKLRGQKVDFKGCRSGDNGKMKMAYANESFILLAAAQLLAIDLNVNALDVRGLLISEYRKGLPSDFQLKYEKYKNEFISKKCIERTFVESMELNGADKLLLNSAVLNTSFTEMYNSEVEYLKFVNILV